MTLVQDKYVILHFGKTGWRRTHRMKENKRKKNFLVRFPQLYEKQKRNMHHLTSHNLCHIHLNPYMEDALNVNMGKSRTWSENYTPAISRLWIILQSDLRTSPQNLMILIENMDLVPNEISEWKNGENCSCWSTYVNKIKRFFQYVNEGDKINTDHNFPRQNGYKSVTQYHYCTKKVMNAMCEVFCVREVILF